MTNTNTLPDHSVGISSWIFTGVAIFMILQGFGEAIPKHAFDASWPDHARFHLTIGVFNQLGLALSALLIARIPFRRRERWSWVAMLIFTLFGVVALIPSALWQGSGPPAGAWVLIGFLTAAMLAALAMTWPAFFTGTKSG